MVPDFIELTKIRHFKRKPISSQHFLCKKTTLESWSWIIATSVINSFSWGNGVLCNTFLSVRARIRTCLCVSVSLTHTRTSLMPGHYIRLHLHWGHSHRGKQIVMFKIKGTLYIWGLSFLKWNQDLKKNKVPKKYSLYKSFVANSVWNALKLVFLYYWPLQWLTPGFASREGKDVLAFCHLKIFLFVLIVRL